MSLHRFAVPALTLAALACQSSIPNQAPPDTVAFAVSFPDTSDGTQSFQPPVPNDLVLQAATATPPPAVSAAQLALLNAFRTAGGFPNDQEVPIQIQFFAVKTDPKGGTPTPTAFPDIDTTTVTTTTLAVLRLDTGTPTPVDFEVAPTDYSATTGVLTIHKKVDPATGARWWSTGKDSGRYVVALRGGTKGVKTKSGQVIAPQTPALLISQDKDLTKAENQGILATQADPVAAGKRLEGVRQLYATPQTWQNTTAGWNPPPGAGGPISAFAAVDTVFPHAEIASIQTFVVDPGAHVAVDPNSGIVPLPSEFLMNAAPPGSYYVAAGGSPFTSHVNAPATGALAALAAGLNTLDGFGTTPMILVPTAGTPIAAASVTSSSVVLLEKATAGGAWTRLTDFTASTPTGTYLTLPPPITIDTATGKACTQPYGPTCVAELIGLQPAVGVPLPDGSIVPLPPLKEHAEYAVIVTNDVKDVAGNSIVPGTLAKLLTIALNPATPVFQNGKSQVAGVSDASAAQLQGLAPLIANELTTDVVPAAFGLSVDPAKIVTAYTFVTESFTVAAQTLAATPAAAGLPATLFSGPGTPGTSTVIAPSVMAKKWGIPTTPLRNPAPPNAFVPKHFLEASLVTLDVLDPASGAFLAPANQANAVPTSVPVLIAIPQDAVVPAGGAPLVIFRHGLGRTRGDMLNIAATFTGAGMVVAAIDAAKFGDRAWCTTDADCATGSTCDHTKFGNQGDPVGATPGLCTGGTLAHNPLQGSLPACSATVVGECWDGTAGITKSSGAFFVSSNLFRLRDSMRQDVLDEAALARAVLGTTFALGSAPAIDATRVFYVGQSLGSINGMVNVAVTPAFTSAVLNAGGGTFTDIAADSPAFQAQLNQLVTSLGVTPGSAAFVQLLQVFKWVIDPADPINFASTLAARGIPILGQAARCDNVVPNKENQLFYGLLGKAPTNPTGAAPGTNANLLQWYMQDTTTACPTDGTTGQGATHGFLLDFTNQQLTINAQTEAARFLLGAPLRSTPVLPIP
jgi:hypothetical protein